MVVPRQLSLIEVRPLTLADLTRDPGSDYGEVFTRRWIVELILDLVGYTVDQDLAVRRLVEPSCGTGAFLVPVIDRLLASCSRHGRELASIGGAIRAFDLLDANAEEARKAATVRRAGVSPSPVLSGVVLSSPGTRALECQMRLLLVAAPYQRPDRP